jgi:DNA-binding transcriptional ArsR family regulator
MERETRHGTRTSPTYWRAESIQGAPPTGLSVDSSPLPTLDSFERLLWWLFAGSAGARTRKLVIFSIKEEPRNAQQLSIALKLDYTTVRHHLKVLESNRLVLTAGDKYGKVYFISDSMEAHWDKLREIIQKNHYKESGAEK